MGLSLNMSVQNAKSESTRRRGTLLISEPNPRMSLSRMEQRASNFSLSATLIITVQTTTPSSEHLVSAFGWFLMYLASVDAILKDRHETVIDRAQLPLPVNISGKGKQPVRTEKAGTAPQHSNYYTPPLKLLLISETV